MALLRKYGKVNTFSVSAASNVIAKSLSVFQIVLSLALNYLKFNLKFT